MENTIIMMIKKLKNNKGMTLTEMLAATIIMLLVSMGLASGVALSNKEFTSSIKQSEALELYSTLSSLISNELRYTSSAYYNDDGEVSCMFSVTYAIKNGYPSIVVLDDAGSEVDNEYGELAFGYNRTFNRIIGSASYTYNLGAKINSFTYNHSLKVFTVDLAIGEKGTNDSPILEKTFNVRALNMADSSLVSCDVKQQ